MSQGQCSPVPWAPARQTRPAAQGSAVTRRWGPGARPPAAPQPPRAARSPSRPSLRGARPPPGRPANGEQRVRAAAELRRRGVTPSPPPSAFPTPTATARAPRRPSGGCAVLTAPPRGPVFPGEPCRKREIGALVSSPLQGGLGPQRLPAPALGHTPICSSASPPRVVIFPRGFGARDRASHRSTDPSPRVSALLSQVFSSPFWYLVSLDAWQALGPWNSWGPLFPLRALRRKERRGVNQVRCPDMRPTAHLTGPALPDVLEGLAAPLAPSHPGRPEMEWKKTVKPGCQQGQPPPARSLTLCDRGALCSCCHQRGGPLLHFTEQQTEALAGEASHRLGRAGQMLEPLRGPRSWV